MSKNFVQTDEPIMNFDDWLIEVCIHFSKAWKIDSVSALAKLSIDGLEEWYKDGFTPYATFRETYQPLF